MIKFEIITEYKDKSINLPKRGTKGSAGYDIEAAEDIIIPSIFQSLRDYTTNYDYGDPTNTLPINFFQDVNCKSTIELNDVKKLVKSLKLRTMIPTGLKVKMDENIVLELHPRSSIGSNCLLQLANQTGIIDSDYYNNEDNEGHIFVPLINLSPVDIKIKKGDKIAQGIFVNYLITDDDYTSNERTGGFGSTDKEIKGLMSEEDKKILNNFESELDNIPVGETKLIGNTLYKNDPQLGLITLPISISTNDYPTDKTVTLKNTSDKDKKFSINYAKETTSTTAGILNTINKTK